MTDKEYKATVLTGLAARGCLRYNAMCKQAELEKAGLSSGAGYTLGGAGTGAALGALIQAARGKNILKGVAAGGLAGAGLGAGIGYGLPALQGKETEDYSEPMPPVVAPIAADDDEGGSWWPAALGGAGVSAAAAGAYAWLRRRGMNPQVAKEIIKETKAPLTQGRIKETNKAVTTLIQNDPEMAQHYVKPVKRRRVKENSPNHGKPSNKTLKRQTANAIRAQIEAGTWKGKLVYNGGGQPGTYVEMNGVNTFVPLGFLPKGVTATRTGMSGSKKRIRPSKHNPNPGRLAPSRPIVQSNPPKPPKQRAMRGETSKQRDTELTAMTGQRAELQRDAQAMQQQARETVAQMPLRELPTLPKSLEPYFVNGKQQGKIRNGKLKEELKQYNQLLHETRAYNNRILQQQLGSGAAAANTVAR